VEYHGPEVHSYANPTSTLKSTGATAFSKAPRAEPEREGSSAPVHSYAAVGSTLKSSGATAFGRAPRHVATRKEAGGSHAYQAEYTSFSKNGGTMARHGRNEPQRALCAVHSYGALPSTLKRSGVASFGKLPPLKDRKDARQVAPLGTALPEAPVRPTSPSEVEDPLH